MIDIFSSLPHGCIIAFSFYQYQSYAVIFWNTIASPSSTTGIDKSNLGTNLGWAISILLYYSLPVPKYPNSSSHTRYPSSSKESAKLASTWLTSPNSGCKK